MIDSPTPRLVVGVGASAGGLEAFKRFLAHVPPSSGMSFLLVQHLAPDHDSVLGELLASCTDMDVQEADRDLVVAPDTVYIIQPDTRLGVRDGHLEVSEPPEAERIHRSIDHLFTSLARSYGPRAAGVVLSGAGSDGSSGIRALKARGALTIAQEPTTSEHRGMPSSAIQTGAIDLELPIDEIPDALERFASLPSARQVLDESAHRGDDELPRDATSRLDAAVIDKVAAILLAHESFDLSVYKSGTVGRRVLRRFGLSSLRRLDDYLDLLRDDPTERTSLLQDLMISVTEFFRDADAFAALRSLVIDPLVEAASSRDRIRVWVPGCATGEEVYSIGMEILDAVDRRGIHPTVQVFATDIDREALAFARAAVYTHDHVRNIEPERLQRYFRELPGKGYQVGSRLRDLVSFAVHDLTKDPPFSRMDMVSCRNVLIYLKTDSQRHTLELLHFALATEGHLFLGTSETTGPCRELFSTVSTSQPIFKKEGPSRHIRVSRTQGSSIPETPTTPPRPPHVAPARPRSSEPARLAAMRAGLPPTIVVHDDDRILYTFGELSPYLTFPQDDGPTLVLSKMLRNHLTTRVRGALYKCRRQSARVVVHSTPDARHPPVQITVTPAPEISAGAAVIAFARIDVPDHEELEETEPGHDALIQQLELELEATREDLHTAVEELEASNEELRSSNEESVSMNEELQSANEELEATTEELRSLNEELTTVNAQLREKVQQVEEAHADLDNFFSSTQVATIFLDASLRIKRFTPSAQQLLQLDHSDIGRPVAHMSRELLQHDLPGIAQQVLDDLAPHEQELQLPDGAWYTRRVLPYQTETRRIDGVVATFVDVTELRSTTERLARALQRQRVIARLGHDMLRLDDLQQILDLVVREVQDTLHTDMCKVLELQPDGKRLLLRSGVGWSEGLVRTATVDTGVVSQAGYTLQSADPVVVTDLDDERRFVGPPLLLHHDVRSGVSCVIGDRERPYGVLGAHCQQPRDFTDDECDFLQAIAGVVSSAVQRFEVDRHTKLDLGVAHIIADADGLDAALDATLALLAREVGPPICVELWWSHEGALQLRGACALTEDSGSSAASASSPSETRSPPPIAREAFDTEHTRWLDDDDPAALAAALADDDTSSRSVFALPVGRGAHRRGAVVLRSERRMFADPMSLRALASVGRSIGTYSAQIEADDARRELAAITASSQDAIYSHAPDGTIQQWLPGAERMYGYSAEQMIGSPIWQLIPREVDRQALRDTMRRLAQGEVVAPYETVRRHLDGCRIEVSVHHTVVRDGRDEVVAISSSDRDIRSLKETQRSLVVADQQKDEFIAMLGHELRNPLAAIRNATALLERGSEAHGARAREIIGRQTLHMGRLLDDLLDVSRFIRGKVEVDRQTLDFTEVCREVCADYRQRLAHGDQVLEVALDDGPAWVSGDRVRLTQLVDNLLSNAVKYTGPDGTIRAQLQATNAEVVLQVSDDGIGIEPGLLPHIFDAFRQAEQSIDRSHGGLGLGLALCRSIVGLHDGRIDAHSPGRGAGTTMTVRLPAAPPPVAKAPSPTPQGHVGALTVLVIEDNEDAAMMLQAVLETDGHQVVVAHDGRDGIDEARKVEPDAVVCDIGLPGDLSGYDVVRALRADPRFVDTPVVAVSGYGREHDREEGAHAGFDAHLTKPVDNERLLQWLAQLVPRP